MSIKAIGRPSLELWARVVANSEYSTFFHTPTWAQIVVEAFPEYRIATKGFSLDDGKIAIVPLVSTTERNRFFRHYESMFPGVYGGAVAERALTQLEVDQIFGRLFAKRTAHVHVMGNPYTDQELSPIYSRSQEFTHVLELGPGVHVIADNFRSGHKYSVQKAKRMGVAVGVADTEQDYRSYYATYVDTLNRWADRTLVTYPPRLFRCFWRFRSEQVRLWVARVAGEVVSGCLVLYHKRHAVYWHGATRESHLRHGVGTLLIVEIIKDACLRGFHHFDFNPSGGLEGVEHYKEGFGAQKRCFGSYVWEDNRLYQAYQKFRLPGRRARRPVNPPTE